MLEPMWLQAFVTRIVPVLWLWRWLSWLWAWAGHPAQSGQTVRLPVWPRQQVCLRPVRNGRGASIMNIHYDVTGLLTVVWGSHSGQIVWLAGVGQGRGGSELIAHIPDIEESAGSRQLDRWRWGWSAMAFRLSVMRLLLHSLAELVTTLAQH